jgi:hypothetical protein
MPGASNSEAPPPRNTAQDYLDLWNYHGTGERTATPSMRHVANKTTAMSLIVGR